MTVKVDLPPDVQAGLLAQAQESGMFLGAFVERVLSEKSREALHGSREDTRPIWEVITDIAKNIPDQVFDRLPSDGAGQVDHYIYGLRKRDG
jgi:hypothetical protein